MNISIYMYMYMFASNYNFAIGYINAAEGGPLQPKKMSFVMPSSFWEAEALLKAPTPVDGSGIKIENKGMYICLYLHVDMCMMNMCMDMRECVSYW
jgi:hypothetical protein